jgi:hypothetical protein
VDIGEFRTFAEDEVKALIMPRDDEDAVGAEVPQWMNLGFDYEKEPAKFISRFVDKLALSILGKKSSFVMEDIYRVLWPLAGRNEYVMMNKYVKEMERFAVQARVATPELLNPDEFEGLCSVFKHFDLDGSGELSLEELVERGLIYADQMESYRAEWDRNGDGCFDMYEFCEMMCPLGYRAYPRSKIGSQKDGTKVFYDNAFGCWRLEGGPVVQGETQASNDVDADKSQEVQAKESIKESADAASPRMVLERRGSSVLLS